MNKQLINLLKKIGLYLSIIIGLYFLYNPFNQSKDNLPHSAISFVYAQF